MGNKFCTECGQLLESNPKFCPACGKANQEPLGQEALPVSDTPRTPKINNGVKITLAISAFFLFALVVEATTGTGERSAPQEKASVVNKNSDFGFQLRDDWSFCFDRFQSTNVQCSIWGLWSNSGNLPLEVSGTIYMKSGNRVYEAIAPQSENEIQFANFTINPGEKLKGGSSFDVPDGTFVEKLFIGFSPNFEEADFVLNINRTATSKGLKRR